MGQLVAFLGAVLFGVGLTGASAAYILAVQISRIALLSLASKLLAPKIDLQQTAQDKLFTNKSPVAPQAFVYGQDMLTGPLMYANVANESDLYRIVALTGREIDSFVSFRIDDDDIVIGTDIPDANDTVSGGRYADVVDIATQLGTSTQTALTAFTTAFPSLWTSAHRGRGWSQIATVMRFEGNDTSFENGIPQNLRALVNGHSVYDPRLDSTQVIDSTTSPATTGSGSHRTNDASTWDWSDNPALCLADWLMFEDVGLGEEADRIDWEKVAEAADICEEQVIIPPATSPATTQNRYTCNLTFFADQQRQNVKELIEQAMLGRCVFSQGKWRMYAGAARTATISLSEVNMNGPINVEATNDLEYRFNRVRGKFIDPDKNYQASEYPAQANATYLSNDNGEELWRTIDFNACNNTYEAQRAAIIELRKSRNEVKIKASFNWSAFGVQEGDVVEISNSELNWTNKKFYVTEWELDAGGNGVNIVGVEENDSVYTDPAVGDYTVRTATGELVSSTGSGVKISDATIANTRAGGLCYSGIRLKADRTLAYLSNTNQETSGAVPDGEYATILDPLWVRVTENSGTLDVGTPNVWLALGDTDVTFSIQNASAASANTAQIFVEIADDSSGSNVLASATFTLSAIFNNEFLVYDDTLEETFSNINSFRALSWVRSTGGGVDAGTLRTGNGVDWPDSGAGQMFAIPKGTSVLGYMRATILAGTEGVDYSTTDTTGNLLRTTDQTEILNINTNMFARVLNPGAGGSSSITLSIEYWYYNAGIIPTGPADAEHEITYTWTRP